MNIAIDEVLAQKPALIVSGINKGLNVGDDVTYSGTVAGALEGALLGYQAIAVSMQRHARAEWDFAPAAALAADARGGAARAPAAGPDVSQRQRAARADRRACASPCRRSATTSRRSISGSTRASGRISGSRKRRTTGSRIARSDRQAIRDGFASVTPLQPDLTDHEALTLVEELTRAVGAVR